MIRDLIKGWGFVMLLHYGLLKVLRVKTYAECTIRLLGVCFLVFYGYLPLGMLDRGDVRVGPDDRGPRHVVYGVKEAWEGSLLGNDILDHCCRGWGGCCFWFFWLKGWLGCCGRGMVNVGLEGW